MANILIVDDDPAVQIAIRLMLEQAGHQVTVAGDGRKGPPGMPNSGDSPNLA